MARPNKRSGQELQDVVRRIETALGPDCEVKSPDWLVDRSSGKRREVDVCIRRRLGSQPVIIIEECRDQRRKVGSPYVEQIKQKRDDLKVNKAVIVSTVGFTSGAREKAVLHGISLMTIRQALEEDWHSWMQIATIDVFIRQSLIRDVRLHVGEGDTAGGDGTDHFGQVKSSDPVLYQADGNVWGSFNRLLSGVTSQHPEIFDGIVPGGERRRLALHVELDQALVVQVGDKALPVKRIILVAEFWIELKQVPIERWEYRDAEGAAVAQYAGSTVTLPRGDGEKPWNAHFFLVRGPDGIRVSVETLDTNPN